MRDRRHLTGLVGVLVLAVLLPLLPACGGSSTSSLVPPPPPANTTAPTSVIALPGDARVEILWTAAANAISYDVLRTLVSGTAYTTIAANTVSTAVTDTTVTNGTTYYYAVRSKSKGGVSALSPDIAVMPTAGMTGAVVRGAVAYEDRLYDGYDGMTGKTRYRPVRHADIQLVDASGGAVLLATRTSGTGSYSFDAAAYSGRTVYIRILSSAVPYGSQTVAVKDLAFTPALYAVPSMNITALSVPSAPSVNIAIPASNTADGAFNILDVCTTGFQFINSLETAPPNLLSLTAYWAQGGTYGTWFCTAADALQCPKGAGIYVLNDAAGSQDTDEFDDDVLWHEFGHFAAYHFSLDDSPGGAHYLNANDQDLRLSWSEGWGSFFPAAVKSWVVASGSTSLSADPAVTPLSQYVDLYSTGRPAISIDIAAPESSLDPSTRTAYCTQTDGLCKYASSEMAVANVLWHIMTGPSTSFGMQPIWDAVSSFGTATVTVPPVNLETYWDQFKHLRGASFASEQATVEGYYADRLINYREDAYEAGTGDDTPALAVPVISLPTTTVRYLFKASGVADTDYLAFNGSGSATYTVSTTAKETLKNGADTTIRVIRATGLTTVAQNDNYNNANYSTCDVFGNNCPVNGDLYDVSTSAWLSPAPLSSQVTFVAPATDTYYIEITATPNPTRPLSAGRYGTYTLTITNP